MTLLIPSRFAVAMTLAFSILSARVCQAGDHDVTVAVPAGFVEYKVEANGTRLSRPPDWRLAMPLALGQQLRFQSKRAEGYVSLEIESVPAALTIQQVLQATSDHFKKLTDHFQPLHEELVTIAGVQAAWLEWDQAFLPDEPATRISEFHFLRNGVLYKLIFMADTPVAPELQTSFLQIASSIRLSEDAEPRVGRATVPATQPVASASRAAGDNAFTFATPDGWCARRPDDNAKTVCRMFPGNDPRQSKAVMEIYVDSTDKPNPQGAAEALAGKDGQVFAEPLDLDGIPAVMFANGSQNMSRPCVGAVAVKDGLIYMLIGARDGNTDMKSAVVEVAKSWHWATPPTKDGRDPQAPNATGSPAVRSAAAVPTEEERKTFETYWQKRSVKPVSLMKTFKGLATRQPDGTIRLDEGQTIVSEGQFRAPVTVRVVVWTDGNDVRISHAADQFIFNWEGNPTELRVDGGPANLRHKAGAGELPRKQWAAIEYVLLPKELVIYVNGRERYRTAADFSKVNKPFSLKSQAGVMKVFSVDLIR